MDSTSHLQKSCSSGKSLQLRSILNQYRLGIPTLTHYGSVLVTHLITPSKKLATSVPLTLSPEKAAVSPEKNRPPQLGWQLTGKLPAWSPLLSSQIVQWSWRCLQLSSGGRSLAPSPAAVNCFYTTGEEPREGSESIPQVHDLLFPS